MKILSCPPPNDTSQIMQFPLRLIRRPDQPNSCRGPAEHRNIMKVLPSLQPNEKSHLTKLCRFFLLFQPIKITTDKIVQVPLRLIRSPDQPSSCRGPGAPRRFLLHHNILFLYILHFLHIVIISTFVGCYIRILRGISLSLYHLICKMCKIRFHFLVFLFSRDLGRNNSLSLSGMGS